MNHKHIPLRTILLSEHRYGSPELNGWYLVRMQMKDGLLETRERYYNGIRWLLHKTDKCLVGWYKESEVRPEEPVKNEVIEVTEEGFYF